MNGPSFKRYKAGERESAADHNAAMDLLSNIAGSMRENSFVSSDGVMIRRTPFEAGSAGIKVFEVQEAGTGDGIYNCYEQILDSSNWDGTDGDSPKFAELNEDEIEVLNIEEYDPPAAYLPYLDVGDLIFAWEQEDDEGETRWVGYPIEPDTHIAYCDESAPADIVMNCHLDVDDTGTVVEVNFFIVGPEGTNLDDCVPLLVMHNPIVVEKIRGEWWCKFWFNNIC